MMKLFCIRCRGRIPADCVHECPENKRVMAAEGMAGYYGVLTRAFDGARIFNYPTISEIVFPVDPDDCA